ncbi:MAG: cupredoxin domain-containing protein [Chloroflexi bacterium]|nr:cupredoxin domain-containing protein [Chloroflexota bacterium]
MTDQPGHEPEQRLPARREPSEAAPAERFSAPPSAHARDLSPERAASIVRQSASARWVAFLAVSVVALFTIAYYFYEVGLPLNLSTPRLEEQATAQQVTSIERGYNVFQANCARCHGPQGKGAAEGNYIAPPLNDPMKLFDHLNAVYLKNVLTVGGRYVCGDPNSIMPIWADTNGGPLNYRAIEDLIAFIRSDATQEYVVRDPSLNEPIIGADGKVRTFKGWLDPAFKPDPASTPVPACWKGDSGSTTQAPTESLPPDAQVVKVTAEGVAFDVKELSVDSGKAFGIDFTQKDVGVGGHNVEIRTADGTSVFKGAILNDPGETTYVLPSLDPGTYTFICSVHPIPAMTGTLTVK